MALTTPNENTVSPERERKKLSKNHIAQKVDEYMQDQSPNYFIEHKADPLSSWESRITGFFKKKGENLDFSDDTSRNVISARIRSAILQRGNLLNSVKNAFRSHYDFSTNTWSTGVTAHPNIANFDTDTFHTNFSLEELKKMHLSHAAREKYVQAHIQKELKKITPALNSSDLKTALADTYTNAKRGSSTASHEDNLLQDVFA